MSIRRHRPIGILLFLILSAGCELVGDPTVSDPTRVDVISFQKNIQTIFDANCTRCHGSNRADAGLRLDSWEQMILGSDRGEAIIPFDSTNSVLARLLTDLTGDRHPADQGRTSLTGAEISLLKRWIQEGAKNEIGSIPYSDSADVVYVASKADGSVSLIETGQNIVIRRVKFGDLGFTPLSKPYDIAVEEDGSFWYVSLSGDDVVLKMNRDSQIVARANVESPGLMVINPANDRLYVGRADTEDNPPASIVSLRRSDLFVETIPVTFSRPHAMAIRPQGDYLYSASSAVDQVMVISTVDRIVSFFPIQGPEQGIFNFVISTDGKTMYGTGIVRDQVTLFDTSNPPLMRQLQSSTVAGDPWGMVFLPQTSELYVGNRAAATVSVLSGETGIVLSTITGPSIAEPTGIALSRDRRYVYVAGANTSGRYVSRYDFGDSFPPGTVSVIDSGTRRVIKTLEVGRDAAGMGYR